MAKQKLLALGPVSVGKKFWTALLQLPWNYYIGGKIDIPRKISKIVYFCPWQFLPIAFTISFEIF